MQKNEFGAAGAARAAGARGFQHRGACALVIFFSFLLWTVVYTRPYITAPLHVPMSRAAASAKTVASRTSSRVEKTYPPPPPSWSVGDFHRAYSGA